MQAKCEDGLVFARFERCVACFQYFPQTLVANLGRKFRISCQACNGFGECLWCAPH